MKSVMQHNFSQIPQANIPRSIFNRTHGHKTTFDAGYLIPFYVDEALPGDTFNVNATLFARMTTPIYPIMDNMFMDVHYFAVPNRLIWDNFKLFMGEKVNPDDDFEFFVPQIVAPVAGGWVNGSLSDYFGLPTGVNSLSSSALWHRAYNLIYNEWYRDENLIDSVPVDKDDGPDSATDYVLRRRGKRHDYFTSCLPWPQKGPSVELPLGTDAPVISHGVATDNPVIKANDGLYHLLRTDQAYLSIDSTTGAWAANQMFADLSNATAATINNLRQAFQLQRLYERDARAGSRYTEVIQAHFGVVSPDSRMQRPEYLGGTTARVNMTSIAQTSETATTPLGTLSAIGTITAKNAGFTKSFTEHCVIIGLLSVRADLTYQQGLPRMFSRLTKHDFYWPGFAHLGEQAVLNKEIYCDGSGNDNLPFGYQERWAEYRYYPSKITGQLRSTYAQSLDAWHLSQEFGSLPALNETFIEENPPMARILAIDNVPHFILDSYIECKAARPMPVYSVPGLIDHF